MIVTEGIIRRLGRAVAAVAPSESYAPSALSLIGGTSRSNGGMQLIRDGGNFWDIAGRLFNKPASDVTWSEFGRTLNFSDVAKAAFAMSRR